MDASGIDAYMRDLDSLLAGYIPPTETWTPVDEALYGPRDPFRVPADDAKGLLFKAVKHAFEHHYVNSRFYQRFCHEHGVGPSDIRDISDFAKIPLISHDFFKGYPLDGKGFASWLGNIYTGELPEVVIGRKNPSFDDVLRAFESSGVLVVYSSGSGGKRSFVPRDKRSVCAAQYSVAKCICNMFYPYWDYDMHMYWPVDPRRSHSVARGSSVLLDIVRNVRIESERQLSLEKADMALRGRGLGGIVARLALQRLNRVVVNDMTRWLVERNSAGHKVLIAGLAFSMYSIMCQLEKRNRVLGFGRNGGMITVGGWKTHESERVSFEAFRSKAQSTLGIPLENCLDAYTMTELNACTVTCPEGHYLHIPHAYLHVMALDDQLSPRGFGEWGRLAFLDPLATSYPGFIMTGDRGMILERCPVCDRPGPVLQPEVGRMPGHESRGCAEELGEIMAGSLIRKKQPTHDSL